jgi:hypothetical protein
MNWGFIFATGQVLLACLATIGYVLVQDWKHAVYWILAAALTAVVTWWF